MELPVVWSMQAFLSSTTLMEGVLRWWTWIPVLPSAVWGGGLSQPPGCQLLRAKSLSTSSRACFLTAWVYVDQEKDKPGWSNAWGTCCRERYSTFQALLHGVTDNIVLLLLCLKKEPGQTQISPKQGRQSVREVRHYPDASCRAAAREWRLPRRGGPGKEGWEQTCGVCCGTEQGARWLMRRKNWEELEIPSHEKKELLACCLVKNRGLWVPFSHAFSQDLSHSVLFWGCCFSQHQCRCYNTLGATLTLSPECHLPSSIQTSVSIVSVCIIPVSPFSCMCISVFIQDLLQVIL